MLLEITVILQCTRVNSKILSLKIKPLVHEVVALLDSYTDMVGTCLSTKMRLTSYSDTL